MDAPLKVLVVDPSPVCLRAMGQAVEAVGGGCRLAMAPSESLALKMLSTFAPDLVLLDLELPGADITSLLGQILREQPGVTVVVMSGIHSRSAEATLRGLTAGAADFIVKPTRAEFGQGAAALRQRLKEVFALREARKALQEVRLPPTPAQRVFRDPGAPHRLPHGGPPRIATVGIAVSTGGPSALELMIPRLSAHFPVPIVVVQHMPPVFTASLARSLNQRSRLRVCEAREGQPLEPGCVYLAPGGFHLEVRREGSDGAPRLTLHLRGGPPVNSCKPAADVLFRSLAATTGANTLAVVMTGMGQDGLAGVGAIKAAGGYCLTQSAESCVVYGMPQAVAHAGLSDESIHLERLAERIAVLANAALPPRP